MLLEPINPEKARRAFLKIKEINHLHSDVNEDTSVIPCNLISFEDNSKCAFWTIFRDLK